MNFAKRTFPAFVLLAILTFVSAVPAKAEICLGSNVVEVEVVIAGKKYNTGFCYRLPKNALRVCLRIGKECTDLEATIHGTNIILHNQGSDQTNTLTKVNDHLYKAEF